jgi:ankyrin repeat protein
MAKLLLSRGADINSPDRDSKATPLHYSASWGRTEMVSYLLDKGADAGRKNKAGKSAAELAESSGNEEVARLIRAFSARGK